MTPEKFKWNSPEGEKEISRQVERRVAHDEQARQLMTGDADETNLFERMAPPFPDVYGLDAVEPPRSSSLAEASSPVVASEFPIARVMAVISQDPNSGYAPSVTVSSLNRE